ncbi:MAG: hypothetical protein JO323_14665 [Acidobacteriia bacterium]|nr:hypothetical protein [Terriglobia bacterium]
MVDLNGFASEYASYLKALEDAARDNKRILFETLKAAGITRISVTFDGEGDSGQIEAISAFKGEDPVVLAEEEIVMRRVGWGSAESKPEAFGLSAGIEAVCCDFLEFEHGGWENNDGAFGEFTLDVTAGTVDLEFNARFSDVHTSTHSY